MDAPQPAPGFQHALNSGSDDHVTVAQTQPVTNCHRNYNRCQASKRQSGGSSFQGLATTGHVPDAVPGLPVSAPSSHLQY